MVNCLKFAQAFKVLGAWLSPLSPKQARRREEMLRFYSQFVQKGDLVFDVGANLGNRTEVFLKIGARVICVEPQESCIKELRRLFGDNGNVTIVERALGESEGASELLVCEEASTISTMSKRWTDEGRFSGKYAWTRKQPVIVTTLDALIRQYGVPRFCKIDVEGYEVSVINGLSSPIPVVSFEFTKEFLQDAKTCMERLSSLGQVQFNCSFAESMKLSHERWMASEDLYAQLDSIVDKELWGDVYARLI